MVDPTDECVEQQLIEFDEKKLKSATKKCLDIYNKRAEKRRNFAMRKAADTGKPDKNERRALYDAYRHKEKKRKVVAGKCFDEKAQVQIWTSRRPH